MQPEQGEAGGAWRGELLPGTRAILPLWAGAIPIGVSYALASRQAGLTAVEAQLMSLTISSAGVQLSAAHLLQGGAPAPLILLTALALTAHQALFGVALGRAIPLSRGRRLIAAALLNDGPFAVATSRGRPTFARLLGAELSMYVVWNAATLLGLLAGARLPQLGALGLDLLVPLLFLALLLPQLRSPGAWWSAAGAGALTVALGAVLPGGVAVLAALALTLLAGGLARALRPRAGEGA